MSLTLLIPTWLLPAPKQLNTSKKLIQASKAAVGVLALAQTDSLERVPMLASLTCLKAC